MADDKFIPPANFAEFYQQNPLWVRWFACHMLHKHPSDPDVLDLEQDLLLHLATLPARSKLRAPDAAHPNGHTDRISTFDDARCGGHNTAPLFFGWLDFICKRYFFVWSGLRKRDVLTNYKFSPVELKSKSATNHRRLIYHVDFYNHAYINEFRAAIAAQKPQILPFLDALIALGGDITDATRSLGYTKSQEASAMRIIKTAAKRFAAGKPLFRIAGRQPSIKLGKTTTDPSVRG